MVFRYMLRQVSHQSCQKNEVMFNYVIFCNKPDYLHIYIYIQYIYISVNFPFFHLAFPQHLPRH